MLTDIVDGHAADHQYSQDGCDAVAGDQDLGDMTHLALLTG